MEQTSDIIACIALGGILQVLTAYYCQKNPALGKSQFLLQAAALSWIGMVFFKWYFLNAILPPADSVSHEFHARTVAQLFTDGHYETLFSYFGIGNRGYRFVLGLFYAITGLNEMTAYAVHAFLACWGMISLLDLYSKHFKADRIPFLLIMFSVFSPSTMFWAVGNLKEGAALWGICMMLRFTITYLPNHKHDPQTLSLIGFLTIAFLRPQIAVLWMAGIACGMFARQLKPQMVLVSLAGIVAAFFLIQQLAPGILETIAQKGLVATAEEEYQKRVGNNAAGGGMAITFARGKPTPFVSGCILILARPYPTEARNMVGYIASAETWLILSILVSLWCMVKDKTLVLRHPLTFSILGTLFGFSFFFSYMYNMGLMVRQRLMAYPLIFALMAIPALAEIVRKNFEKSQKSKLASQNNPTTSQPQTRRSVPLRSPVKPRAGSPVWQKNRV